MSELIDRQKLIVKLKAWDAHTNGIPNYAWKVINELPPVEPKQEGMTVEEYRQRMMDAFHNADCDELIALVVLPSEKEFEHLEWLLEKHYKAKPEPKQGKWILVHGEPPKNSLSTTKIFAECSCCGEPLKSHGREIGWGYYPKDGRTIIWSGFITNYSSNPEAAKAFAMKAAESVPEDAYPKYCENCGAKMQGGDTDVNDK